MQTPQDVHIRRLDKQELQELYGAISYAIECINIEENAPLEKIAVRFEESMTSLITALKVGSGLSAFDLSKYLVILIDKIITFKNENDFSNIKKLSSLINRDDIINLLQILYRISHDELVGPDIQKILCKMQTVFAGDFILNAKRQAELLKKQQSLWVSYRDKSQSLDEKAKLIENINLIDFKLKAIEEKTKKIKDFCNKNKVKPK